MTRANEWSIKVLALLKGGNTSGASAQIKVAPSVKDLNQLSRAIQTQGFAGRWPSVEVTIADQVDALSAPRLHRSP